MCAKISVTCAVLCILSLCCGHENSTQEVVTKGTSNETLDSDSNEWISDDKDLDQEASIWRLWRPFRDWGHSMFHKKFTRFPTLKESGHGGLYYHSDKPKRKLKNKIKLLFKLKQFEMHLDIMFYVDSQRTVTRRDSSLIAPKKQGHDAELEAWYTAQGRLSNVALTNDSMGSVTVRPKGSVRKELITMMFDSMLDCIVESWETILPPKGEDSPRLPSLDLGKAASDTTILGKKKKSMPARRTSKSKRSRSRVDDEVENESQTVWWSSPDEKAIIRFRNGNMYEGNISSKCMHGEGRFQWADGTVYLGQFKDNEMYGKGKIQWKNDSWYEGEFAGNLRHGKGLYVDSRSQRSYTGGWHCGTKHGDGVIYYSKNFKNSYDGQWIYNERYGYGSREYCELSGYKGDWDRNEREGKGIMIWPNHDFYRGGWQNGVMSGYGIYIWDACCNNTMALPSINGFRGMWEKGMRNGYGLLNLGLGLGSHYKGEFKKNKKHGYGKFVTNNGFTIQDKNLFADDIFLGPTDSTSAETKFPEDSKVTEPVNEPYQFDICDSTVGLIYHIEKAFKNIDRQAEIRTSIVNEYLANNQIAEKDFSRMSGKEELSSEEENRLENIDDLFMFEETALSQTLKCYVTELLDIYYKYATICNTEPIEFTPVLIRLFLWQLYYDCNIHEKGLTLVEIDRIFHQNPDWLGRTPHNPFEKVYFWQFLHSLISVASKLYARRELPGTKPDTILASAFRNFMELDVLRGSSLQRGHLVNGYGKCIPLKATYELYCSLGEPHTVRTFLCAVRRQQHCMEHPQPNLVEVPNVCLPLGRNVYIFGDDLTFIIDNNELPDLIEINEDVENLKLFNLGNLSSKTIIRIFSKMFPSLCEDDKIMDLDIELTFLEFFEALITCAEESIRVSDEELKWRNRFSVNTENLVPPSTPTGHGARSK